MQKELRFSDLAVTFGADVFNIFNGGTVLQRELNLGGVRAAGNRTSAMKQGQ